MEKRAVPVDTGGLVFSEPEEPTTVREESGIPNKLLYPGGSPKSCSAGEPDEPDGRVTGIPDYPTAGG